jgi:hypothetical protein
MELTKQNLEKVQIFAREHRQDDVRRLALQAAKYPDMDFSFALHQIKGWQVACKKLPSWAAHEQLLYPQQLSMEQCSSEQTARYKQQLVQRLCGQTQNEGILVDLTGGLGVDFSFMAQGFRQAYYVEQQVELCALANYNFPLLGLSSAQIICGDGTTFLQSMADQAMVIFLDPARRDAAGSKTYAIEDCTPDVALLSDELVNKAQWVVVKLSPMLDWHAAVAQLKHVCEVHIVGVGGECKELLLVMQQHRDEQPLQLYAVNDGKVFTCSAEEAQQRTPLLQTSTFDYLFEPHASLMKAGCFGALSARYGVKGLATNTHLFAAMMPVNDFPGRQFRVLAVTPFSKKSLRSALHGIEKANLAVRNFPLSVVELRKRLKLKEGGEHYLFATTIGTMHALIICKKIV